MGDGEQRTGSSIGRVLAVQAVAYVVLFGVTGVLEFTFGNQGGVAQGVAIALAVVLLVLFQVGWPFRAGIADRLIGAVAGVLSILCARTSLASQLFYPAYEGGRLADDGRLVMYQLVRWAACFAILLIAATIIAFGRADGARGAQPPDSRAVALHDGGRGLRQRRGMVFCARSHRHGLRVAG